MQDRCRAVSLNKLSAMCKAVGAVVLCGAVVAPLATFATATASAAPPVEAVPGTSTLGAVACSTSANCVAVGSTVVGDLNFDAVVVSITNGVPGTAQVPFGFPNSGSLSGVACPTSTTCYAVGDEATTLASGGLLVPITNGVAGTAQTLPEDLTGIVCTSSTQCLATTGGGVVPITNGTPGTPEEVSGAGTPFFGNIACLSATDCVATGYETVPTGSSTTQQEGASVAIINGTLGSVVLDSAVRGFGGGTCPTATSCLFSANSANAATSNDEMVVPMDGNANPGTAQLVPGGANLTMNGDIACPSSPNNCSLVSGNDSGTSGYIVPITNGTPGNPVPVPGTIVLSGVTCPTSTGCLLTGFASPPEDVGAVVPVSAPSNTMLLPSNNATVNGSIWLDAGPASPVGLASATFEVSGGPNAISDQVVGSGTPTLYGWIGAWDTFDVPNGTYTIQSVATDVLGLSTTSAPVTVTVDNPTLQSTTVIIPSNGGTLSGSAAVLDAVTSGAAASVQFVVSGLSLSNDVVAFGNPTIYGWLAKWDTTGLANGTYTLQSVATDATGATVTSPGITVTIAN